MQLIIIQQSKENHRDRVQHVTSGAKTNLPDPRGSPHEIFSVQTFKSELEGQRNVPTCHFPRKALATTPCPQEACFNSPNSPLAPRFSGEIDHFLLYSQHKVGAQ